MYRIIIEFDSPKDRDEYLDMITETYRERGGEEDPHQGTVMFYSEETKCLS